MIKLYKYKACICEGSAEKAIMNILLDNDLLIFKREELLEEEVLSCRSAKNFEERYLRKTFDDKISVIRILDSRKENFKLSKAYENKIDVVNIITAPEIEILVIIKEGKYLDFKKSKLKPSDYCKQVLKIHNIKNYDFVIDYFSDVDSLVAAMKQYKQISNLPKGELSLIDLLAH
jgi:hypothetical protein